MSSPSDRLVEAGLVAAAKQWKALGVSVAGVGATAAPVDPEALILFVAALADADARLREESMDWCVQYGTRLVSTSRLRNLRRSLTPEVSPAIDRYIATVNGHASTRWPLENDPGPVWRLEPSGKSRLPRLRTSAAAVRLQLRTIFGVTARAEVLLVLAASGPRSVLTASQLQSTAYSKRNVALVLEDLALAEIVSSQKIGNRIGYRLAVDLRDLAPTIGAEVPRWDLRLALFSSFIAMVTRVQNKASIVRGTEARRWVSEHDDELSILGLRPADVDDPQHDFDALVDWATDLVASPHGREQ